MHKLTITLLLITSVFFAKGQTDTVIRYISDAGIYVKTKDSANTVRKIYKASASDSLYLVRDYYINGSPKFTVTSSKSDGSNYKGYAVEFYPNGNKKSDEVYLNNALIGPLTSYFPNGALYLTGEISSTGMIIVKQCRDTTGAILANNGNGLVITYDENFKHTISFGNIKDGLRIGRWTCTPSDSVLYVVNYKNGLPISQAGIGADKKEYPFNAIHVPPEYNKGYWEFYNYVQRRLNKNKDAKKAGTVGTIHMTMIVDVDGTLSNIKVTEGLGHGLDDEAIKAIETTSRSWIPAKAYGIPEKSIYKFTVNFGLNTDIPSFKYNQ